MSILSSLRIAAVVVALGSAAACARSSQVLETEFYPSPRPGAVFAQAVRVGNLLFLSGEIGTDANGRLVQGGLQMEARQALNNIKATTERLGSSMDHIVKCTVFLADIKDYADFNEIYASYFRLRKPARSAMAAAGLALGARVEIDCVAVMK